MTPAKQRLVGTIEEIRTVNSHSVGAELRLQVSEKEVRQLLTRNESLVASKPPLLFPEQDTLHERTGFGVRKRADGQGLRVLMGAPDQTLEVWRPARVGHHLTSIRTGGARAEAFAGTSPPCMSDAGGGVRSGAFRTGARVGVAEVHAHTFAGAFQSEVVGVASISLPYSSDCT